MRLLFVCTGNICRSPVAERITAARAELALGQRADQVQVSSAGTEARSGDPLHPASAQALVAVGGDPAGFASRPLVADDVVGADLVLTMSRRHRHLVITAAPSAMRRTFTVREAAALLSRVDPADLTGTPLTDRARALAGLLQQARRHRASGDDDDIRDPIGLSASVHDAVAHEIAEALGPLTGVLFDAPSDPPALPDEFGDESTEVQDTLVEDSPIEGPPVEGTGDGDTRDDAPVAVVSDPVGPGTAGTQPDRARPVRRGLPRSTRGQGRRR